MAQPRKSEFNHFKETCVFKPSAREEELLARTVHPDEFKEAMKKLGALVHIERDRRETLEVRINELLTMLHTQFGNSGFLTLKVEEP